jgi:hypothetical protein
MVAGTIPQTDNVRHSRSDYMKDHGLTHLGMSDSQNVCGGKCLRPRSVNGSEGEW